LKLIKLLFVLTTFVSGCAKTPPETEDTVTREHLINDNAEAEMAHPELEFFNSLSAILEIELTTPPEQIGNLLNERATPEARIQSIKLTPEVYNRDTETFRELTNEEIESIAFQGNQITLRGEGGGTVTHDAPNGRFFTVKELFDAVAETEKQSRHNTEWFGGVDVHHIFFEGIHHTDDDIWEIYWGS
jgi:hypothetical protein